MSLGRRWGRCKGLLRRCILARIGWRQRLCRWLLRGWCGRDRGVGLMLQGRSRILHLLPWWLCTPIWWGMRLFSELCMCELRLNRALRMARVRQRLLGRRCETRTSQRVLPLWRHGRSSVSRIKNRATTKLGARLLHRWGRIDLLVHRRG